MRCYFFFGSKPSQKDEHPATLFTKHAPEEPKHVLCAKRFSLFFLVQIVCTRSTDFSLTFQTFSVSPSLLALSFLCFFLFMAAS